MNEFIQGAKICFITQAPNEDEYRNQKLFAGSKGNLLRSLCYKAGIDFDSCSKIALVTDECLPEVDNNMVFRNRYYQKRNPFVELIIRREIVRRQLCKQKHNLVIPLDEESAKVFNISPFGNWTGSVLYDDLISQKLLCVSQPTHRNWETRAVTLRYLQKAKLESTFPVVKRLNRELITEPNLSQVLLYLRECDTGKMFSFDIETHHGRMDCIGFSYSPEHSICIPFYTDEGNYWNNEDDMIVRHHVQKVLENPNNKAIAQNGQYDCVFLKSKEGIDPKSFWFDTMCAFHTIQPELDKDLGFLESIYTDQPYHKIKLKEQTLNHERRKYNALDACVTFEIATKILSEMDEIDNRERRGVKQFYFSVVHPLLEPLMHSQMNGIRMDVPLLRVAAKRLSLEAELLYYFIQDTAGRPLNPQSPKQVSELLYHDWRIRPHYKGGKLTVNEEKLEEILRENPNDERLIIIDYILGFRKRMKLVKTYLDEGDLDKDGRIHCSYSATTAVTGRLSSRESIIFGGTNLQNFPSGIARRCIIPDKDFAFIEGDLSQADAHAVGFLADEQQLISIFESGGSVHKAVAKLMFGYEVEKGTKEYKIAKANVHASNYGAGPKVSASLMGIPVYEAKKYYQMYHDTFPGIHIWQRKVREELKKNNGVLYTPLGRRRQFHGHWGDDMFREAYAQLGQGTVADALGLVMISLFDKLKILQQLNISILNPVHDSLLVQCPESKVDDCLRLLKDAFKLPIKINQYTMTIPVEFKKGLNWDEMEEI